MKISKISFKNIHSLKGEHHIDFLNGALAEGGLFAITGATGSGKSTLLDVITLALYNRIPRMEVLVNKNILEGEGGIITRNTQDCYAEVEYIVSNKKYRSHWSIERNRNNKLKDRKQELIEVESGNILDNGKTSVPKTNAEIIGLSYEQFIKAMVLSQGQFSKLLKANRDDRNKLLEDITGAKDYRVIGQAVFAKFKVAEKSSHEKKIRLEEIDLLPEEQKNLLKIEQADLIKQSDIGKKEIDVLRIEIENKKAITTNENKLLKNDNSQKSLNLEFEKFKSEARVLIQHTKYVEHSKLISDFEQKDKELTENLAKNLRLKNNEIEVLKVKESLLAEASKLLKKEVQPNDFINQLSKLSKLVTDLRKNEDLAITEAKIHSEALRKQYDEINRDKKRLLFTNDASEYLDAITIAQDKNDLFLESSKILNEAELAKKEALLNSKSEIINNLKLGVSSYNSDLKIKINKEKDLKVSNDNSKTYKATLDKLIKECETLDLEVKKLTLEEEHRKKHLSLESHRSALVEGEACPLCGALDHPFAIIEQVFDLQIEQLNTKVELLKTKNNLRVSVHANLETEQKNIKRFTAEIANMNEDLSPKLKAIQSFCDALQIEFTKDLDYVETIRVNNINDLKLLVEVEQAFKLRQQLIDLKKTTKDWLESTALKNKKERERKDLYTGDNIEVEVRNLQSKWSGNIENIKNLNQAILELKEVIKKTSEEKEKFQVSLNEILKHEEIENISKLKSFILSEKEAQSIRKKEAELQLLQNELQTEKKLVTEEIERLLKLIKSPEPIQELENKFKLEEKEFNTCRDRIIEIQSKLDTDNKSKAKQQEALKELEYLKKEETLWKTMNGLIGDANGKKFSNFVQDLTLEQLIGFANRRLKDLSDRYTLDIPTADEASKNDSLKVFDCYMGDARRSINTLSGGETFMVSLAMAFALSDLAAKNVKIESIFIDEGFGTLDPETLDQAITILEKMQNEGDKSIGVISHVEALKERISTQIKLEKTGSGYSTIKII